MAKGKERKEQTWKSMVSVLLARLLLHSTWEWSVRQGVTGLASRLAEKLKVHSSKHFESANAHLGYLSISAKKLFSWTSVDVIA